MKLLKAYIEVIHPDAKSTAYNYPGEWIENKQKIPMILYPGDRTDEVVRNGKLYQIIYPVVPDDIATLLLATPDFSLAEPLDVQVYADKHAPQRVVETDRIKVLTLLSKKARSILLTQEEKDILDPEHPAIGLNLSKKFIDICKEDYAVDNI